MKILFNDPAEYYFVCSDCYYQFAHMQWAGSTRGIGNWRKRAEEELAKHESIGAPCEFCGPHGNGRLNRGYYGGLRMNDLKPTIQEHKQSGTYDKIVDGKTITWRAHDSDCDETECPREICFVEYRHSVFGEEYQEWACPLCHDTEFKIDPPGESK